MIFLKIDSDNKVTTIYYYPFDLEYGLHQTEEELLSVGYLVDSIPDPEVRDNYAPTLYYNPVEKTFYYVYTQINVPVIEPTTSDLAATQTVIMEVLATMCEGLITNGLM